MYAFMNMRIIGLQNDCGIIGRSQKWSGAATCNDIPKIIKGNNDGMNL